MSWWQRFLEWLRKLWRPRPALPTVGCIDFSTTATGANYPNPWKLPGTNGGIAEFLTIDPPGSTNPNQPAPNNRVRTANGSTGLDCNFTLDIKWSQPASQLTFKLLHTSQSPTIEAKDSSGTVVGTWAQTQPQHVVFPASITIPGMVEAVVHSPAGEVILIEFCAT